MAERSDKPKPRAGMFAPGLVFVAGIAAGFVSPVWAQYSFDPSNADENSGGIKYFGSAKDDRGALLPGVTIIIGRQLTLVTDVQGRFRGAVDPMYTPDVTPITCSKPGYQFLRVTKRPGPMNAAQQTVEANCILHKIP